MSTIVKPFFESCIRYFMQTLMGGSACFKRHCVVGSTSRRIHVLIVLCFRNCLKPHLRQRVHLFAQAHRKKGHLHLLRPESGLRSRNLCRVRSLRRLQRCGRSLVLPKSISRKIIGAECLLRMRHISTKGNQAVYPNMDDLNVTKSGFGGPSWKDMWEPIFFSESLTILMMHMMDVHVGIEKCYATSTLSASRSTTLS